MHNCVSTCQKSDYNKKVWSVQGTVSSEWCMDPGQENGSGAEGVKGAAAQANCSHYVIVKKQIIHKLPFPAYLA